MQILSLTVGFPRYYTSGFTTLWFYKKADIWLWSPAALSDGHIFSCSWGHCLFSVLPFSDVSFALWWSSRILIASFALLVIRSSLCSPIPVCRDPCYASTPLSFQPALALPCHSTSEGQDDCLLQRLDSLRLCAQLLQRKLFFSGIWNATQANKYSFERADKNSPPSHSSSVLPPGEDGNLTLLAAIPAWAHLLHKSPSFSLLYVLTLSKCLRAFPWRSSLSVGSSLTLPSNSCEQPLLTGFSFGLGM